MITNDENTMQFIYTPQMFGAVGNGTNDDTNAFKQCFLQNETREVYVPKGNYIITDTISIPKGSRMTMHPEAILRTYENITVVSLDAYSQLIGGRVIHMFDDANITEILPAVKIGERDGEYNVNSNPGQLKYATIRDTYIYRSPHIGTCIAIEAGAKYTITEDSKTKIYYRETYFCTLDNVIVNGGACGIHILPCITHEDGTTAGWNNAHSIKACCTVNDCALNVEGNGNKIDIIGQSGKDNAQKTCVFVNGTNNTMELNIFDVGLYSNSNDCLVNVIGGTGNILKGYYGGGYVDSNYIKGNILNLKEDYSNKNGWAKKYDGNNILANAVERGIVTATYTNMRANENVGYNLNQAFYRNGTAYMYPNDIASSSTAVFEFDIKTSTLLGFGYSFNNINRFDSYVLSYLNQNNDWVVLRSGTVQENEDVKFTYEEYKSIGTYTTETNGVTKSVRKPIKKLRIEFTLNPRDTTRNIQLLTLYAYDNENIGSTVLSDGGVMREPLRLTSPNGTVYKLTVSDNGTLTTTLE